MRREIMQIIAVVIIWKSYWTSADDQLLPDAANMLDRAALEAMETDFPHHRATRSIRDRLDVTREAMKGSGDRQKLLLEKVIEAQKIAMNDPTDICLFQLSNQTPYNPDALRFAVAENSQAPQNWHSFVKIYRQDDAGMVLDRSLDVYAPHRLEKLAMKINDKVERFLAVGGMVVGKENLDLNTKLTMFKVNDNYKKTFEMPMTVLALTYISTGDNHFLIVADKISQFTSFITVVKYDVASQNFILHERFPVATVSDIEAVTFGREVYLIVAIYMNYFGNLQAKSLVFKYNRYVHSFRPHTDFETTGARDIALLNSGLSNYVIVANEASGSRNDKKYGVSSYIYRIEEGFRLKPITSIATIAAKQIAAISIPSCSSKTLIIALDASDSIDQMSVYLFDSDRLTATHQPLSFFSQASVSGAPNPQRFASFIIDKGLYVAVATANKNLSNFLRIKYEVQDAVNPLQKMVENVKQDLAKTLIELMLTEMQIRKAKDILSRAMFKAKEQNVKDEKHFIRGISARSLLVKSVSIENGSILFEANGSVTKADPNQYDTDFKPLHFGNSLMKQKKTLDTIKLQMEKATFIDKPTNLSSTVHFESAKLLSLSKMDSLEISSVNGINTSFLVNDIVLKETNDIITGKKSFTANVTAGSIDLIGRVNYIDLSKDAVTVYGKQVITSSKVQFDDWGFNDTLQINGTINDINVSTDLLSLYKDEAVYGQKSFAANVAFGKINLEGVVDDISLTEFAADLLRKNSDQNITGKKIFNSKTMVADNLKVRGLVKYVDLQKLSEEAIHFNKNWAFVGKSQVFLGPVHVLGNISVSGNVNGLVVPDECVLVHKKQTISGHKTFNHDLHIKGDLFVSGHIDGKKTDDFVLLSKDQTLSGSKRFLKVMILQGSMGTVNGRTVNGVILHKLNADTVKKSGLQNLSGRYSFRNLEFNVVDPTIKGLMNGMKLKYYAELFAKALLLEGDQQITGECSIVKDVAVEGNLTVLKMINEHSLPKDYLYALKEQEVPVECTFSKDVHLKSDVVSESKISGVDLSEFATKIIGTDTNGTINGRKGFQDNLTVFGGVRCQNINGVDVKEDMMRKDTLQNVGPHEKYFKNIEVFNDIDVHGDVKVSKTVDGVDLSEFKNKSMLIKEDIVIVHKSSFTGNLNISHMKFQSINDINFDEFVRDIVYTDGDQLIRAGHSFERIQAEKDLKTNSTIDDIQVQTLKENCATLNSDFSVDGRISFTNILALRNLEISGKLHEESLEELNESVVLKYSDYNFTRGFSFNKNLEIKGNIRCKKINGLSPNLDFVLRTGHQAIIGKKLFVEGLDVRGGISANGSINGADIRQLNKESVKKSVEQIISGKKRVFALNSSQSITMSGNIDGVKLSKLKNNVVFINRDSSIAGPISFQTSSILKGSMTVYGLINQRNLSSVINDAVLQSTKQNIAGQKHFAKGLSTYGDVTVDGDVVITGLVNGYQCSVLTNDVLLIDGNQTLTGKKVFKRKVTSADSLSGKGTLNDIDLKNSVVVQGRKQNIYGKMSFMKTVHASDDVKVYNLVDGHDLSALKDDTLIYNATLRQAINGTKRFIRKAILKKGLTNKGKLDGETISQVRLVNLHGNQSFQSRAVFLNGLNVDSNVISHNSSLAVGLDDVMRRRLTLGTKQTVHSNVLIDNSVVVQGNLSVKGTVNGIDVEKRADILPLRQKLQAQITQMEGRQKSFCNAMDHVYATFKASVTSIDYFEAHQVFKNIQSDEMYHFTFNSQHYMAISIKVMVDDPCTASKIYKWNYTTESFNEYQNLMIVGAKKFAHFNEAGQNYLFVATMAISCLIASPSELLKWNTSSLLFEPYQALNAADTVDALAYNDGNGTRLVIANVFGNNLNRTGYVNILVWFNLRLNLESKIMTNDIRCIRSFKLGNKRFIAVAVNYDSMTAREDQYSTLYTISAYGPVVFQRIYQCGVKDIVKFEANGETYLIIAYFKEALSKRLRGGQLSVNKYSKTVGKFLEIYSVPTPDPFQVQTIELNGQTFLSSVSCFASMRVMQHQVGLRFKELFKLDYTGLIKASYFTIGQQTFISLAAYIPSDLNNYSKERNADSRILKVNLSGFHPSFERAEGLGCK